MAVTTTARSAPAVPLRRALLSPRAARITAPLLFLVAWQVITPFIPTRILPLPAEVVEAMVELVRDGGLVEHFGVSLARLGVGFVLGLIVGGILGLAMGLSPRIDAVFKDFTMVGLAFPYLIWGLLVAMWFGFSGIGPIVVVFIAVLPYAMLNISEGVRDVSKDLRDMAAAYEVPRSRALRHLVLPSLSPFFFASLRYGLGNGWKALVLAEVFAATSGAGYAITEFRDYGNFAGVIGFALYFALFSIIVERLVFGRLSRWVFRWRPAAGAQVAEAPE